MLSLLLVLTGCVEDHPTCPPGPPPDPVGEYALELHLDDEELLTGQLLSVVGCVEEQDPVTGAWRVAQELTWYDGGGRLQAEYTWEEPTILVDADLLDAGVAVGWLQARLDYDGTTLEGPFEADSPSWGALAGQMLATRR